MHRTPKNNQWGKSLDEWKGCSWILTFHVNSRMVVDHAQSQATKQIGPDITGVGHAHAAIQPFDNLRDVVTHLLINSAINAVDELMSGEQGSLWDGPDTPA